MTDRPISNVSDTARWVAVYRAWETARPDALFRDPYAERLAGDLGKRIVESLKRPSPTKNGWPMITRTKLIDDLVMRSVAEGHDCVLNLAAGLDTRPWRMALPPDLTWIEADLPAMTEEKAALMAGEKPVCALRCVKIDLADPAARAGLFDEVNASFKRVLVLSEGLLIYLDAEAVSSLGRDLRQRSSFHSWMLDLVSPAILRMMHKSFGEGLVNAPMKFGPENGVAFFEPLGWKPADVRSLFKEGARFKRVPWYLRPFALLPEADPRNPGKRPWSAIVRFEQA